MQPTTPNPIMNLVPIAAIFAIFYFLLIRPQQKQQSEHDAMLKNLKVGDKILTSGGLYGSITGFKGGTQMVMELEGDKREAKTSVNDAMSQAIEIIRNRVDQFGVAEPLIVRQGARWIVVQLPGVTDSVHAKELVGKTALLQFRM